MYVSYFYSGWGNSVAAYWEIAAHSAYDLFSFYKYQNVNLVYPKSFLECDVLSNCAIYWTLLTMSKRI